MLRKLFLVAFAALCTYASAPYYEKNELPNLRQQYNQNVLKLTLIKHTASDYKFAPHRGSKYRKLDGIFHQRRSRRS